MTILLRQSRPYKPFSVSEENESASSVDESDDEGLTDYSSDSDDLQSLRKFLAVSSADPQTSFYNRP